MASSKRSTPPAKSSATTSPAPRATSTSSPTRSTSSTTTSISSVVVALGSNLGDRRYHLARAVFALGSIMRVVRVSKIRETVAVGALPGSPPFLNMVVAGHTSLSPEAFLAALLSLETRLGRRRRGTRNEPRVIDLDLIVHGAHRRRTPALTLPHPRASQRAFVMDPLREISPLLPSAEGRRGAKRG